MILTTTVEKIYDIADIKDSGFFLLEYLQGRFKISCVLTKEIEMKEVCTV
jgi:hypothetical protein